VDQPELALEWKARDAGDRTIDMGYQDHHAVVAFRPRAHLLKADAVVQCETRAELVLVTRIVAAVDLLASHKIVRCEAAGSISETQQEGCEAVAPGRRERTERRHIRVEVE